MLFSSLIRTALTAWSETPRYRKSLSLSSGFDNKCGDVKYRFNSLRASSQADVHSKFFAFFMAEKNIKLLSVDLEMNLFRAAILPASRMTSFGQVGEGISSMDLI